MSKKVGVASGGIPTFDAIVGPTDSATGATTVTNAAVPVASGHSGTYILCKMTSETLSQDMSACVRNGQSFTRVGGVTNSSDGWVQVWELKNPTVGSFDVVATVTSVARTIMTSVSYYYVNQSTPLGTAVTQTGNNTAWSQSITTAATDLVIDFTMSAVTTVSVNAGQTTIGLLNSANWSVADTTKAGTGGSVSMGYTINTGNRQFSQWTNVLKQ